MYFLSPSLNSKETRMDNEHYLQEFWDDNTEFCGINNDKSKYFLECMKVNVI